MSKMLYCGSSTCYGHGDYAICGKVHYGPDVYQCESCQIKQKDLTIDELRNELQELKALLNLPVAYTSEDALADVYCGSSSIMGPKGTVGDIPLYAMSK